jgi:hypothetical protein
MKGFRRVRAILTLVAMICISPMLFMSPAGARDALPDGTGSSPADIAPSVDSGTTLGEVLLWVGVGVVAIALVAAAVLAVVRYQHHGPHVAHPA